MISHLLSFNIIHEILIEVKNNLTIFGFLVVLKQFVNGDETLATTEDPEDSHCCGEKLDRGPVHVQSVGGNHIIGRTEVVAVDFDEE